MSAAPRASEWSEDMPNVWKKGRGKLGFVQPLLGRWAADADSPMGPLHCTRVFELVLGGSFVQLTACWRFGAGALKRAKGRAVGAECADVSAGKSGDYQEIALIGAGDEGRIDFWSFTSDGKRSHGTVADVADLHADAIGFEAQMPAGFARMAYWPEGKDGFVWVVESKNAKGWRRFVEHHYRPA